MNFGDYSENGGTEDWLLYKRTSTVPQAERGTSMDTQDENCRKRARELGYTREPKYIFDDTESGAFMERQGLEGMLEVVSRKEVSLGVVHEADRLFRDPLGLLNVVKVFSDNGVRLEFVNGPSPDTPEGELIMFLLGWAGKNERNLIKRRTMEGREKIARAGRLPQGSGKGLYGYDYNAVTKRRTINDAEAAVVRMIQQWIADGNSVNGIACRLNEMKIPTKSGKKWGRATVRKIATNTAYYGLNYYGQFRHVKVGPKKVKITPRPVEEWIPVWGFTPPIISKELHDRVQEQLKVRQAKNKKLGNRYLLTGFTRCGKCGSRIVGAMQARGRRYYRCIGSLSRPERSPICNANSIREEIEGVVWDTVAEAIRNPELLSQEVLRHVETGGGNLEEEVKKLRREIADNKEEQRRYLKLYGRKGVDQDLLESESASLMLLCQEKEQVLRALEEQKGRKEAAVEAEEVIAEYCRRVWEGLDDPDFDRKRATLAEFGVKVVASRDSIAITIVVGPDVTGMSPSSPAQCALCPGSPHLPTA